LISFAFAFITAERSNIGVSNITALQKHKYLTRSPAVILLLGFIIRILGINFGLPDLFHADEAIIVNHAVAYGAGDFNPHFFGVPPFLSYLLFFFYGILFFGMKIVGQIDSVVAFQKLFLTNPSIFYLLGRFIFGVCCGTGSLAILYVLIRKNFSKSLALLTTLFLAFNFLHVRNSHYLYFDLPLMVIILVGFFYIFKVMEKAKTRYYVYFGACLGFAVGMKYNGVFLLAPFLVANVVLLKERGSRCVFSGSLLSAFASIGCFVLVNPFAIIDHQFFLSETLSVGRFEGFVGWTHHFSHSLIGSVGLPVTILAVIGMVVSISWQKDIKKIVFLSFVISYYIVLCLLSQPYPRYVLPLIPFVVFFAADALIYIREKYKLNSVISSVLIAVVMAPSLLKTAATIRILMNDDTRTISKEWIEEHIEDSSKIALSESFFAPRLKRTKQQLEMLKNDVVRKSGDFSALKSKKLDLLMEIADDEEDEKKYEIFFISDEKRKIYTLENPTIAKNFDAIKSSDIDYVVFARDREDRNDTFYQNLIERTQLVKRFTPYKRKSQNRTYETFRLTGAPFLWKELNSRVRNGNIIEIYRIS
jgi:hypothetical protein